MRLSQCDNDPSWWDEGSILMAIDMGIDEGGDGNDKLLVSVQVGVTDQAKKLKKAWSRRLPADLPYFHSKDFGNYTGGVFTKAGLQRTERQKLLVDLCQIIHRRLLGGVTIHISISEYNRLTTQAFRSRHGTAYGFAVDLCMLGAYKIATEHQMKADLNVLIEDGHRNANQVAQILMRLQKMPDIIRQYLKDEVITDLRVLSAGLGNKKDHPILQSADMLVYSEFQRVVQGDASISRALLKSDLPYVAFEAHCDGELIKELANLATPQVVREWWNKVKRRVREAESKP